MMKPTVASARYTPTRLAELRGNPLAEALPPRVPDGKFIEAITDLPDFAPEQRQWPSYDRIRASRRLQSCLIPLPDFVACYDLIHGTLSMGYADRNPMEADVVQWQYDLALNRRTVERSTAETIFITGLSGLGKTTMLRSVLSCFPQVIVHEAYEGQPFLQQQVVYIYVEIPPDASRKAFCLGVFDAVDKALGREQDKDRYGAQYRKRQTTVEAMQDGIRKIVATHCVGGLFVDELQNLSVEKSGGKNETLKFFDALANQIGVPIITIGTTAAMGLFGGTFRSARRVGTGGELELERHKPDSAEWHHLVKEVWPFQWVRNPQPLTSDVVELLFDLTQGLPAVLFRLLQLANQEAITSGAETVDSRVLQRVYQRDFRLIRHALSALRRSDVGQFEDLMTVGEFFAGASGRSSVKQLLQIAQRHGLTGDTAKAMTALIKDVEQEQQLSAQEKRKLARLREELERKLSGDDDGAKGAAPA